MTAQVFEPDGETLERYLMSPARVRKIQGPRGSAKSSTSAVALMMNAQAQTPCFSDGIRRTRFYIIRNTYDELKRTTLATWKGIFPEADYGLVKGSRPFEHTIRKGDIEMENIFLALDNEDDVKKLLSTEASGVWVNEFREVPRSIIDALGAIIGRYPNKKMCPGGCTRPMIVADTNAPPETHWFSYMSGQTPVPPSFSVEERRVVTKPDSWDIFIQPPAMLEQKNAEGDITGYVMNPKAENVRWLPENYYPEMIKGKDRTFINVNVLNRPGTSRKGKAVWGQFQRDAHVAKSPISPYPGHTIMVGVDFGRTPAAIMAQRVFNRWFILGELCAQQMGAKEYGRLLKNVLAERFPGHSFAIWGDPAGEHLAEADDISPFLMFRAAGLRLLPAPTNDPVIRRDAVIELLNSSTDGAPRLLIDPGCVMLIGGMEGGYHYRRMGTVDERYSEEAEKNEYSHPADALQYLVIGAGEGRALLNRSGGTSTGMMTGRTVQMPRPQGTVFDRRSSWGKTRR